MKTKLRTILITSLFLSTSVSANQVVAEGKFKNLNCSVVGYTPLGEVAETKNFEKNYFDNMNFSITKDSEGYKLTTALYSGQFVDVNQSSDKFVFVQFYNRGTEIATIVVNKNTVTYTNTSGSFYNRLCVGKVVTGINTY
ncbi:hypothetical protein MZJ39_004415 [Vibrio parahaemolyticus]|nr:hypothetical protein [Vibrio parahaemolyticus]EIE1188572.1 hypothetical protein [Vibrio parahaemolyticus]EJC6999072.1 hypothetical protein [Vibrio parahaemolyticus]EJC7157861.1 hypothetical protein [Vibrio parahaemolyticus]EJG2221677.1 hypothetical protein [Vibrio parahaemolyticus]